MAALAGLSPGRGQAPDPEALYRSAYEAYNAGELATAHSRFAQLVQLAPQVAVGHAAYGEVLLAEGRPADALRELEVARQLDPHTPATEIAIGNAWFALDKPGPAAEAFAEAVSNGAPLSPEESRSYATALAATGHAEQAIPVLQAALETPKLAPAETAALEDAWGTLLAQRGNFDQATQHFTAALGADPNLASAHAHLGSALLAAHQPAGVDELRRALALAPNNISWEIELGQALTASGQDAEALTVLRQAVASADQQAAEPLRRQARYALALALQAGGDPKEALPLFAGYTAAEPGDTAALTNYALALVQTGDARRAVGLYQQALAHGPDNATLRQDYGVAYLQQSDLDHALEQFRAGLALEPENPHLHYDLGLAYKLKDNLDAAIPEFERAQALDPALPDPAYTLGVIHMQQGEFAAAASELEKTVALQPNNAAAWAVLGNVYKENGDPAKATAALRRAIGLDPGQPSTHITLAAILAESGDKAGAAEERRQAAELSRAAVSRQRASFALKSGWALLEQGKVKEAEAQLRTAIAADPKDPAAHEALAEALAREGRAADAAVERQQAGALGGGSHP
jgi:tetratricopeptide (TPR) repeat protein